MTTNTTGELTKAFLTNVDTKEQIEFLFNPTEYSMSKSNNWDSTPIPGFEVPPTEFQGGQAATLNLDLFFDTFERNEDVRNYTDKVVKLTKISPKTKQNGQTGRPPQVLFNWGKVVSSKSIITSLSIKYTLFKPDGTPVRATMSLSLQECENHSVQRPQNPTSQGSYGHKVHVVQPGDTIGLIAYKHYGNSRSWRLIADTNGLDNPKELQTGQALEIVPEEI